MSDTRNQLRKSDDKEEAKPGSEKSDANSRKVKFGKWFLAAAGSAAVAFGIACSDASKDIYYPACPSCSETCEDGGQDTEVDSGPDLDADVDADTDSGPDLDGGPDLDADVDADTDSGPDLDGGPDLDADVDADTDSGPDLDGGPDLDADVDADTDSGPDLDGGPDLDADVDSGPSCIGVYDQVVTEETFDKGTAREVGGYMITYVSQTSGGITIDIGCTPGTDDILMGESLGTESEESYEMTSDSKRIRITVHSRNTWNATMSVTVENL